MKTLGTVMTIALSLSLLLAPAAVAQQKDILEELSTPNRPAATEPVLSPAQQEQGKTEPTSQPVLPLADSKPTHQGTLLSSSILLGTTVKNAHGEEIGKLQEVMIDPQNGRVASAVLAFGGVLGVNAKRVTIPWEALKMGITKDELVVEVDSAQFHTGLGAATAQRPAMAER